MTCLGERLRLSLGFSADAPAERIHFPTSLALASVMAALPLLLHLPIDTDRVLPLFFLPAIGLAWNHPQPAARRTTLLLYWGATALLLSALMAAHGTRAYVTTAAVGWTLAGAATAHTIASSLPAIRLVLWGITLGAVLGTLMISWGVGAGHMPFPTYWSARLFGAHQFTGCLAVLGLLLLPGSGRRARPLVIVSAVVIWTGLAWSGSRGPVIGLLVMVTLWFWRGDKAERRALLWWIPLLTIAALTLSYPLGAPYIQMGWHRQVNQTLQSTDLMAVTSGRTEFWSATWQHILQTPWFGHGADGYLFLRPAQWGSQPHNVVLQWLLDFGLFGAVPLLLLVGHGGKGLFLRQGNDDPAKTITRHWASAALVGAFAYGMFEGVFYHMIVFMPVAVIAGCAIRLSTSRDTPYVYRGGRPARIALLATLPLLGLHGWLSWQLRHPPFPAPDSMSAKVLRAFPSTTDGLVNWIQSWRKTHPAAVLPWIRWAQTVAPDQGAYHIFAAQLLIWENHYAAAEFELLQGHQAVTVNERPDVEEALRQVRLRLKRQQAGEIPPPRPLP